MILLVIIVFITIFVQFEESKTELKTASKVAERYRMAAILLIVIIIACIGIIVHQQMGLNNYLNSHSEFRKKMETLVEQKGAYERKSSHALTLKKQTDQFLNRTLSDYDRLVKDVKECQIHLQQLVQNVAALAGEKDGLARKLNLCYEKLTECEATKTS